MSELRIGLDAEGISAAGREGFIQSLSEPDSDADKWVQAVKEGKDGAELSKAEAIAFNQLMNNHIIRTMRHIILENNRQIARDIEQILRSR